MRRWSHQRPTLVSVAGTGREILGRLVRDGDVRGTLTDAQLAALAIDHGVAVVSTDADFARFGDLRWINPLP